MISTLIFTSVSVFLLLGMSLQNPLTWNYLEPHRHFFVDEKYVMFASYSQRARIDQNICVLTNDIAKLLKVSD